MFFVCIILFYLLYAASAPAWCYILNCMAMLISLFRGASIVDSFIYEANADAAIIIGATLVALYYIIKNHPPGGGFRGRPV